MAEYTRNKGETDIEFALREIAAIRRELQAMPRLITIDRLATSHVPQPVEGQIGVESATELFTWFSNGHWRIGAHFELKVFGDSEVVTVGDSAIVMCIPDDLVGCSLSKVAAFVSTAGSVTVQIRNVETGHDMLSTALTIDAAKTTSYTAATPAVVSASFAAVSVGDRISVDVDAAGGVAEGLGVILAFYR